MEYIACWKQVAPKRASHASPPTMACRKRPNDQYRGDLPRLALLESLQQALGLLHVAARVGVLRLHLEHDLPLRDRLRQLFLAKQPDAFLVVAIDDVAARLR